MAGLKGLRRLTRFDSGPRVFVIWVLVFVILDFALLFDRDSLLSSALFWLYTGYLFYWYTTDKMVVPIAKRLSQRVSERESIDEFSRDHMKDLRH